MKLNKEGKRRLKCIHQFLFGEDGKDYQGGIERELWNVKTNIVNDRWML